jgi:hypothetical protein
MLDTSNITIYDESDEDQTIEYPPEEIEDNTDNTIEETMIPNQTENFDVFVTCPDISVQNSIDNNASGDTSKTSERSVNRQSSSNSIEQDSLSGSTDEFEISAIREVLNDDDFSLDFSEIDPGRASLSAHAIKKLNDDIGNGLSRIYFVCIS